MKNIYFAVISSIVMLSIGISTAQEAREKPIMPRRVEVDSNYDGKADRVEIYEAGGQIEKVESDTDGNGVMDEWVIYKNGKPVKSERDTNGDGKPDVWIEY